MAQCWSLLYQRQYPTETERVRIGFHVGILYNRIFTLRGCEVNSPSKAWKSSTWYQLDIWSVWRRVDWQRYPEIENLSDYSHHIQWKAYHVLPAQERLQPLDFNITKVCRGPAWIVLFQQVLILIQDPAHIVKSKFPAMAWTRLLECRVRTGIRLYVHTPALTVTRYQISTGIRPDRNFPETAGI